MQHTIDVDRTRVLRGKKARILDVGFFVSAVIAVALWGMMPDLEVHDFTLYWQATANLVRGINPYAFKAEDPVSLNSPMGLGLLWFVGTLPYPIAKQLYLTLMYFSFLWSIWIGYKIFLLPFSRRRALNMALLVVAIPFGMFFQIMVWGSTVVFALIGITGFYCLDTEEHPFLAGCLLGLCLIKPHLFILALAWITWRSVLRRHFLLPAGIALVAMVACLSALYLQPGIFRMYATIYSGGLPNFAMTNAGLGNILYSLPEGKHTILLFAPLLIGLCALPLLRRWQLFRSFRLSCVCLLPWSALLSAYCWGHDYAASFATTFLACSVLLSALGGGRAGLVVLMSFGILANSVVGNVLSPGFTHTWSFILYGLSLAAESAMAVYAYQQLTRQITATSHFADNP